MFYVLDFFFFFFFLFFFFFFISFSFFFVVVVGKVFWKCEAQLVRLQVSSSLK